MKRDLLLIAFLIAVSLAQNLAQVATTPFHPDETRWLNRGRYIQEVLTPRSVTWSDHFLTRGQPPGGSYLMGLGLLAHGRPLEPNRIWHFAYDDLWNVHHGNMPAQVDLTAGRRTNAVVGAFAVGIVYLLGRRLTTRLGGVVGAVTLAFHPLMIQLSSQALADTSLVLVLALTALAACRLADRPSWPRALLLGALLGLGGLVKLSPLLLALPLAALGALLILQPHLPWPRLRGTPDPTAMRLGERLLPLPVMSFTAFVAGYPYLWPDPLSRTYHLFAFRTRELAHQAATWPNVAIGSREEVVERIWRTLSTQFSVAGRLADATSFLEHMPSALDLVLALGGIGSLLWLIWRRGLASPQAVAGLILLSQTALIVIGLRVDYARYYLPLVFVGAVTTGVLAGFIGMRVAGLIRHLHQQAAMPVVLASR
jgi:hypothetical protein